MARRRKSSAEHDAQWVLELLSGRRRVVCTTVETFRFPGPQTNGGKTMRVKAMAQAEAAKSFVGQRDAWPNPPSASAAELKKHTLINSYNERPSSLPTCPRTAFRECAHKKLDDAALDAM